uniref:Uncharacterized protein n=1 Tax=Arundo donax TaxID=35708 RepID=A0A0A8ZQY7_ARUDO
MKQRPGRLKSSENVELPCGQRRRAAGGEAHGG